MKEYRRGAVLGLTVAETFILLTFLLLIALLGLVQQDGPSLEPDPVRAPGVWMPPDQVMALKNKVNEAREAENEARRALATAESDRDAARHALIVAERERDAAQYALAKGKNPPCWYQVVRGSGGKMREKSYYLFNAAIYEDGIELAPRKVPPGGAFDDGGGLYSDEWKRLRIDYLPYGKKLSDDEFIEAVKELVAQGRNRLVRTYECVFSVMVWDKTPDHAKGRWKYAHDRIIEGFFSAYTVQDMEWKIVEPRPLHGWMWRGG